MSQEYKVMQFKKGDYKDDYGNYWCDMALEGVGEPVRIVVKDPMQYSDGMTLYGDITEKTSKAGKTYLRFKKAERPEYETKQTQSQGNTRDDAYWQHKDAAIRAQWAIGQAVNIYGIEYKTTPKTVDEFKTIEITAEILFSMVDRVAKPEKISDGEIITAKQVAARVDGKILDDDFDEPHLDPDELNDIDERPIKLEDIPF